MKKIHTTHASHTPRTRGSVVLGMVYGMGMLALALLAVQVTNVTRNISAQGNHIAGARTFVSAESGAREGVYQLFRSLTYAGGSDWAGISGGADLNGIAMSDILVDVSAWPLLTVTASANNVRTVRSVRYFVRPSNLALGFSHAIFAEDNVAISGNVKVQGSVYAGGTLSAAGNSLIEGDVFASGSVTGESHVAGEVVGGVTTISAPIIDPSSYMSAPPECVIDVPHSGSVSSAAWTNCLGSVVYVKVPSGREAKNGWPSSWQGVVFVEGDASLNGGTFSCAGSCTDPLAFYVTGDLELKGNVSITGLVYVQGETTIGAGTPHITGSLMSAGIAGVGLNGNLTVTYDPVIMGNWEHIGGLDVTGHTPPVVSGWGEV